MQIFKVQVKGARAEVQQWRHALSCHVFGYSLRNKLSLGFGFLERTEGAPRALAVEVENHSVAGAATHLALVDWHHRAAMLDPDDGGTGFPGGEPGFCHA